MEEKFKIEGEFSKIWGKTSSILEENVPNSALHRETVHGIAECKTPNTAHMNFSGDCASSPNFVVDPGQLKSSLAKFE